MITFKSITLQNFLSFGNSPTTVNLDTSDITLILGQNNDTGAEGYSRNGVGKSTIFQAISFALWDQGYPNNNTKKDEFVNIINKKKMLIELEIDINGVDYKIRRGRKPNICEILRNGEPFTMHSIKTNDEAIGQLLGINAEIFFNTVMLTTNNVPFMGLKPAAQRDFIETILSLHVLSDRAGRIKMFAKENTVEIKIEEQNKVNHETNMADKQRQLDKLLADEHIYKTNLTEEINRLESELADILEVDIDAHVKMIDENNQKNVLIEETNQAIRDVNDDITNLHETINKEYDPRIDIFTRTHNEEKLVLDNQLLEANTKAQTEIQEVQDKVTKFTTERSGVSIDINNLTKDLESIMEKVSAKGLEITQLDNGECPLCKQAFTSESHRIHLEAELETLKEQQLTIEIKVEPLLGIDDGLTDDITSCKTDLADLKEKAKKPAEEHREDVKSLKTDLNGLILSVNRSKISESERRTTSANEALKAFDVRVSELTRELHTIELSKEDLDNLRELKTVTETELKLNQKKAAEKSPYKEQIHDVRESIIDYDYDALHALEEKDSHYKLLVKLLTDNKSFIRKNLIDQYIPFINDHIKRYLQVLDIPHRVEINNDLTVQVTYMNEKLSYGSLSNGEKNRVNTAVSLSFRELVGASINTFNGFFIDELLDNGLDSAGFHSVLTLLKNMNNASIFLISHREELIPEVCNIITVVKQGGFSKLN